MSYYSNGPSSFRKDQHSRNKQKDQVLLYSTYGNKNQQNPLRQQSSVNRNITTSQRYEQQVASTLRNVAPSQRQTVLQQEQINDLERKIDLILMHNQKLQSQKQRYRLLYEQMRAQTQQLRAQNQQLRAFSNERAFNNERGYQSNTARFVSEQNSYMIDKLRKQLELTIQSYQNKLEDAYESRKVLKQEISTLTNIIEDVNRENKQLKLSIKEQSLKVESLTFQLKEQFIRQQAELQNKLRDQFLIREIDLKNEKKQLMETYEEQIKEMKQLIEDIRQEQERNKEQEINRLLESHQEQRKQLANELNEQKDREIQRILFRHRQDIKRQQDKAIQYINESIVNVQQKDQLIKLQYQEQINRLKDSLENRKILIDTLLNTSTMITGQSQKQNQNIEGNTSRKQRERERERQREGQQRENQAHNQYEGPSSSLLYYKQISTTTSTKQLSWLPQLLTMKTQLQQLTTQYLQESQLLKLKLTEKFHSDINSLKNLYQNKIELLSQHNTQSQQETQRLRNIYQNSLQQNIKNKKQHQLEKSKLKNIIRKLNIELHGIQQEYKLNIEGVRSMNNTFSMTMMKSMIEVKQKANFYTEENRKLRKAYQEHETQITQTQKLCNQKVQYYEQKCQAQKQKSAKLISDLKHKLQLTQQQAQERESQLRENLNKQHEMIHDVVSQLRKDLDKMEQQNQQLNKQCHHISATFKDKDQEIAHLKSFVSQLEADVEKLKLDLSMAGVEDQNHTDTINQWKNHYETTISQLNQQKQIIQSKLNTKHQQLIEIVKKYQLLENNLNKVLKSLNKKSQFQNKLIEVGLDTNLVHNLAQLFPKQNKQNIISTVQN